MNDYKDAWQEKYSELALELFDKQYWECTKEETATLDKEIQEWSADYLSSRIDRAHEEAKYRRLR